MGENEEFFRSLCHALKKDTRSKCARNWTGCVDWALCSSFGTQVRVETQWLKKEKNQFVPWIACDGKPYTSIVDCDSIMFHNILTNISPERERSGPYTWPDQETKKEVMLAYVERDKAMLMS
jgi:hypothetical protein